MSESDGGGGGGGGGQIGVYPRERETDRQTDRDRETEGSSDVEKSSEVGGRRKQISNLVFYAVNQYGNIRARAGDHAT